MDTSFKIRRTVVTLEPQDMMQLSGILTDEDREEAYRFLAEVVYEKIKCAQTELHVPEFEGGSGDTPAHFFGKEEGRGHKEETS